MKLVVSVVYYYLSFSLRKWSTWYICDPSWCANVYWTENSNSGACTKYRLLAGTWRHCPQSCRSLSAATWMGTHFWRLLVSAHSGTGELRMRWAHTYCHISYVPDVCDANQEGYLSCDMADLFLGGSCQVCYYPNWGLSVVQCFPSKCQGATFRYPPVHYSQLSLDLSWNSILKR